MSDSRIPGLYKLSVSERIDKLEQLGWLSSDAARILRAGREVITPLAADNMIENVIGVFGLPLAIVPNFVVNGRECIVPLVVEEPSIVAGLSNAAALARSSGGFTACQNESLLAGQIHVTGVADIETAMASLRAASDKIIGAADNVHPRLAARGGGVRGIEVRALRTANDTEVIAVHVMVDTCDAMGANLVNTICESLAPRIAEICAGDIALRILSNLADQAICTASVRYGVDCLASDAMGGAEVRDRIVLANDIAIADPHRAATHNKGIMNGIDALAIATGNDWRAIEAGAHAFAARDGNYAALTRWSVAADGSLLGEISLPLKPGIVGGTLSSNPGAAMALAVTGVESATQLAELMAAVGLAQNFAALRALVSSGIQDGHMRLHARSFAAAAAPDTQGSDDSASVAATAAGKVILLGEHAVVFGRHALAVPIADAVRATASAEKLETTLVVPEWGLQGTLDRSSNEGIDAAVNLIRNELGTGDANFRIIVNSSLPRGMGLGSSAAIAVAITRALASCSGIDIGDDRVNAIAYACEQLAHGTPSGIDNTLSCYGTAMLFRNADSLDIQSLQLQEAPPLVVAFGRAAGPTDEQVAGVRSRFEQDTAGYDALFDQMDEISQSGTQALLARQYDKLGRLMNVCHGLLNAIEVSTPDLENMVAIARENGASGAKLTGAGGGGSIVALCPGTEDKVIFALQQAGYKTLAVADTCGK